MSIYYNRASLQVGCQIIQKPERGLKELKARFDTNRVISKDEYQVLLNDLKLAEVYVTIIELWFSVVEEIRELKSIVDGFSYDFYKNDEDLRLRIARKQERKVERRFMNMLTLFKSFLDQVETFLKRNFKHLDDASEQWKAITAKAFDSNFSYRFIYKLRNYVQHVGMAPIMWLNSSRGISDYSMKMYFSRDELLLNKSILGSIVIKDLESMPEHILAADIMEKLKVCLSEILYDFIKIIDQEVRAAALRVVSYRDGFQKSDDIGIYRVSIDPENQIMESTLYKYINDANSILISGGFPYIHDSTLHPDLR